MSSAQKMLRKRNKFIHRFVTLIHPTTIPTQPQVKEILSGVIANS